MSREVPEGWRLAKLYELSRMKAGGTPARSRLEYYNGDIPWLKSGEINQGRIWTTEEKITEKGLAESSAKLIPAGTPVVAMYGATAGVVGFLEVTAAINQAVLAVQPTRELLDADFCLHMLSYQSVNLLKLSQGSGQPNLSKALIENLEVSLPPLHEQSRIAEVLSSVDEAIAATRAVIEQTRKVKQGVLERLLTKGIGHTRFKQTEIGEIPEEWEVVELQAVAAVRTGLAKNKKSMPDAVEIPYLRVANVQDSYIDLSDLQTISVSRGQVERYSLKKGDVLMTEGGDYDKLGRGDVWDGSVQPCLHQNHVFAVRANQTRLMPEFLANLTASRSGKAYFQSCSKRSTNLASINSTQVKQFPVRLPDLGEQSEIVRISKSFDTVISVATSRLSQQQRLKSALMSDLLTGRKRVTEALPVAAE